MASFYGSVDSSVPVVYSMDATAYGYAYYTDIGHFAE
jgi:hypothetical protein